MQKLKKNLEEAMRKKRMTINPTHLTPEEAKQITNIRQLDEYMMATRYRSRYWQDPKVNVDLTLDFVQKTSKADLRKFLHEKQQAWWYTDQEKRGIKTFICQDCGSHAKPGHTCLATASTKVKFDKKGLPMREVAIAKGQDGRIKEDNVVIPDMSYMQAMLEKAQQKAQKSKITLPPISKSTTATLGGGPTAQSTQLLLDASKALAQLESSLPPTIASTQFIPIVSNSAPTTETVKRGQDAVHEENPLLADFPLLTTLGQTPLGAASESAQSEHHDEEMEVAVDIGEELEEGEMVNMVQLPLQTYLRLRGQQIPAPPTRGQTTKDFQ
jgi:hypothetical protein